MSEQTETGHGLQIVSVTKSHSYVLEKRELEELLLSEEVKDLPVVVVSVAGAYRGGKSFMLNFFLRYLTAPAASRIDGSWLGEDSEPLAGFTWRSGITATTMGMLMWSKPFITTLPSGEKVAILLVDTQGTFDSKSTVRDNSTIFALSTLVSSVQIYNLSHDIKEDDLQHLELFTEYGKLLNTRESNMKAFQVLEFLVRDWQYPEDYPYGMVGGERLLEEKLQITDDLAKEMKVLREHIRSSFEKVSCFLMPHPGFKVLTSDFKGNISDIDIDFRNQLKDLANSLFSEIKLLPKIINGERVKARDLFNYFKSYLELFNSDMIPNPTNILGATVKAGLLSAVSEARDVYEKGMNLDCGPKQLFVPPVDLKFLHDKHVESACAAYNNKKKMGTTKEIDDYLKDLKQDLSERLPQFLQINLSKIQSATESAKDAYDVAIKKVTMDKPFCVHPEDVQTVHNLGVEAAIKTYDGARKRVTQKYDDERETFILGFQKQYQLLQRINEQNNTSMVTELKVEYWAKMQAHTNLSPPMSEVDFKAQHDIALKEALKNFETKRNMPNNNTEDKYKRSLTENISESFIDLKLMNKSNNRDGIEAALKIYDNHMDTFWDQTGECLHPNELNEAHRLGACDALTSFRPKNQCSSGFDKNDDDEALLEKIITERYQDFKRNNDNANETAIIKAYNKFITVIDEKQKLTLLWAGFSVALASIDPGTLLLTLPGLGRFLDKKPMFEEAKSKALELFYEQRRNHNYQSSDPFRERLDQKMLYYYQNMQ